MAREKQTMLPIKQDFEQAIKSMDTFTDITADDAMKLAQRAEYYANQRATEALGIRDIMTSPVISVRENTSMSEAAHLLVSKGISGLPVVDESERLVGIITEADFLSALGIPAHQPYHNLWQTLENMLFHLPHSTELDSIDHSVVDHMTQEVISAEPESDIHRIVELMKKHKVKRILICDEQKKVIGIVTRSNLVRLFFDRYAGNQTTP